MFSLGVDIMGDLKFVDSFWYFGCLLNIVWIGDGSVGSLENGVECGGMDDMVVLVVFGYSCFGVGYCEGCYRLLILSLNVFDVLEDGFVVDVIWL